MSNAEKAKPEGVITLGGSLYKIACDFEALCKFEELTGKNPFRLEWPWSPSEVIAMLTAMLQENHMEMTLEKVRKLISVEHLPAITDAVFGYFTRAMPDKTEVEKKS